MKYIMKCIRCGEEMNYIKDEEIESMGFVAMDCPNGCESGYLVPKDNPNLKAEEKRYLYDN